MHLPAQYALVWQTPLSGTTVPANRLGLLAAMPGARAQAVAAAHAAAAVAAVHEAALHHAAASRAGGPCDVAVGCDDVAAAAAAIADAVAQTDSDAAVGVADSSRAAVAGAAAASLTEPLQQPVRSPEAAATHVVQMQQAHSCTAARLGLAVLASAQMQVPRWRWLGAHTAHLRFGAELVQQWRMNCAALLTHA